MSAPPAPVDQLIAIEEIKQLKARYFHCMDTKDWKGLRAVFCDDATFDARTAVSLDGADEAATSESKDWLYHGGDTITAFVRDTAGPLRTVHHGHAHKIEVMTPIEARGVIDMEDQIWTPGSEAPYLHGCGHLSRDLSAGGGGLAHPEFAPDPALHQGLVAEPIIVPAFIAAARFNEIVAYALPAVLRKRTGVRCDIGRLTPGRIENSGVHIIRRRGEDFEGGADPQATG